MKSLRQNTILFLSTLVLFGFLYPLFIWGVGKLTPYNATGRPVTVNGKVVGYENIGQLFTSPGYFHGRPSASNYNDDPSAASNLGPSNPVLLKKVRQRIDTLLAQNPGITKADIPSGLVTSSGSGVDPDISPRSAYLQAIRVAHARGIPVKKIHELIKKNIQGPLFNLMGPKIVNVLKLNIALDKLAAKSP